MPTEIRVPPMGESVTEGVIAQWLKSEGDTVAADEPIVEVETDKITVEVPAPSAGVLLTQAANEGDTVAVGDVIAQLQEGAGAPAAKPATPNGQSAAATPAVSPSQAATPAAPAAAMPAARFEAARRDVDLSTVQGTGRGGRILREDVVAANSAARRPASAGAPPQVERPNSIADREERRPMTPIRRRVAERLVESQNTAAILTTFNEIDMSGVIEVRNKWKQRFVDEHGVKLGFMSFFVKAAVNALKAFPAVNAEIDGDEVVYKHYYDIGVAVGGGKGLVVPVLRETDRLGFADIEKQIADFATRAKNNKLTLAELTGGTFTISNGGVYGSMMSTPILNPPQTGILGLHNIVQRPIAVDGEVVIRPVMYIALSYDHRLIDGREAVQFLVRIKTQLEDPQRLFLGV